MSTLLSVTANLIYTAAFIACLWWANSALRQLDIPRRFNLPASVRLLVVLAVGALVYSPVSRILGGLFALFNSYSVGWVKAADVIGALVLLGFVGWLYTRGVLER
ncbi:hypothetical protein [Candidatus Amarolinea dominans]|uniref:hypothetical protein n=1 Tax=Candidatus Amarolinea dominans TaxID=3140696 RepID=UPI003134B521|nr:hypothetical protein [Anaerolineae bacterium]